jgi:hypothetical protein
MDYQFTSRLIVLKEDKNKTKDASNANSLKSMDYQFTSRLGKVREAN